MKCLDASKILAFWVIMLAIELGCFGYATLLWYTTDDDVK
jgi:hypothetical protein